MLNNNASYYLLANNVFNARYFWNDLIAKTNEFLVILK